MVGSSLIHSSRLEVELGGGELTMRGLDSLTDSDSLFSLCGCDESLLFDSLYSVEGCRCDDSLLGDSLSSCNGCNCDNSLLGVKLYSCESCECDDSLLGDPVYSGREGEPPCLYSGRDCDDTLLGVKGL